MTKVDPITKRPYGDHGTALQAIDFALDELREIDASCFLYDWRCGDLLAWPEYYEWLAKQ